MVTIQKNLFIWVCSGRYLSGSKQISIPTLNNYVTLNISCQEIEKEKLDIRDQIHQEINSLIDARKQVGRNRLLNNWMWFFFFFLYFMNLTVLEREPLVPISLFVFWLSYSLTEIWLQEFTKGLWEHDWAN